MAKSARRQQLLDVAAEKLVAHGAAAMSMERLAEWAGVSKALPYAHFDNVEDLLVALYQRESVAIGNAIVEALEAAGPDDDVAQVRVRAYFDAMEGRGDVIRALTAPGSTTASVADPSGEAARYTARLLYRYHGVPKERAVALGPIIQGALSGAAAAWLQGHASRELLEQAAVAMIRAAAEPAGAIS